MDRTTYLAAREEQKQAYAELSQQIRDVRAQRVKAQQVFSKITEDTKEYWDARKAQNKIWYDLQTLRTAATFQIMEVHALKAKGAEAYQQKETQ